MMRKLKSRMGETLAEVLIALLISAIGMLMLATMIMSSSNSIERSRKALETYYSSVTESGSTSLTATVTLKIGADTTKYPKYEISVNPATKALGGKTVLTYTKGGTT